MEITLERILSLIPSDENGRFKKNAAADFANKIGVAPNLPAEWKAGRNSSYKTKLQTIADAYNVSIDWLYGNSDIKEKSPAEAGDLDAESNALVDKLDYDQLVELIFKATKRAEELKKAQQKPGE